MTSLVWMFTRAQSTRRVLAMMASSAVVTALLLIAVSLLQLPAQPHELLFDVVANPDTRGGAVLAVFLLMAPVLVLTYQVVLLGSASRNRRLATLRITGATPLQARGLGAAELALPAAVGSVAGVVLYFLLRLVIGGVPLTREMTFGPGYSLLAVRLLPTSVTPTWWMTAGVVAGVVAIVAMLGWRATRPVEAGLAGTVRQVPAGPPRPWGVILVVVALAGYLATTGAEVDSDAALLVLVVVAAVGLLMLGPWTAYRFGTRASRRASSGSTLLGSRRLVADPWAAGRAAAPVTVIGLAAGGAGITMATLVVGQNFESFYLISILLVAILILVALTFTAFALAVHSVESLANTRRPTAALAAVGVAATELEDSLRTEGRIVAYPAATAGVLLGALPLLADLVHEDYAPGMLDAGLAAAGASLIVTVVITRVAISLAVRLVRPWLRRAMDLEALRTP